MFSPPDPERFRRAVFEIVREIPTGRVCTYGGIARLLPPPAGVDPAQYHRLGARWVGTAMSAAPDDVPWHRVVNAQGGISQRPGADMQRHLLEAEGVVFGDNGRMQLKRYLWPDPAGDGEPLTLF